MTQHQPSAGTSRVAARPHPARAPPSAVPEPTMDALFGRFWPEAGVPGSARASCWLRWRSGVLAARRPPGPRPRARHLPRPAGRRWRGARGGVRPPRPVHPRLRGAVRPAGGDAVVRDAEWIVVLCVLAGGGGVRGRPRQRPHPPGVRAGRVAWPLAGLRGLPWLGPLARSRSPGSGTARRRCARSCGRCWACSCSGCCSPRPTRCSPSGRALVVPDLALDTFVLRAFLTVAVGGVVLAASYLAPQPARRRAGDRPGAARWRSATSGWCRCCSSTRVFAGVPRRAGHGDLRRARLPASGRRA